MPIELRVLSGERVGRVESFDKSIIALGRHPASDLQFDPEQDLDVSAHHAEIRGVEGRYTLYDHGSTNGSYVNGQRIKGEQPLLDGDVISFGVQGPQIAVSIPRLRPRAAPLDQLRSTAGQPIVIPRRADLHGKPPNSTSERVAYEVREQTKGMQRMLVTAVVVLGALGGGAYWIDHSAPRARTVTIGRLPILNAQPTRPPAAANDPAVVLIVSEINGRPVASTGFSVTATGLIVTSRRAVPDRATGATRVRVKFADTKEWLPAHVSKVSGRRDEDLALIQVDAGGRYPAVQGVRRAASSASVGAVVSTIGYPRGGELSTEGSRNDMVATTTLTMGRVSKRLASLVLIDSSPSRESNGSPVFNGDGDVVGVVWGGTMLNARRIVYAVPGERLADFLPMGARGVVR